MRLALQTLGEFDFGQHILLEFGRDHAVPYLDDSDVLTRKAAALACCNILEKQERLRSSSCLGGEAVARYIRTRPHEHRQAVEFIVQRLLVAAVADIKARALADASLPLLSPTASLVHPGHWPIWPGSQSHGSSHHISSPLSSHGSAHPPARRGPCETPRAVPCCSSNGVSPQHPVLSDLVNATCAWPCLEVEEEGRTDQTLGRGLAVSMASNPDLSPLLSPPSADLLLLGLMQNASLQVSVRLSVFAALRDSTALDDHLSQVDCLRSLFVALNDEEASVRALAIQVTGRLADNNPAYVMPALRRHLLHLLTNMDHSPESRHREESARLLGSLIRSAPRLVMPYVSPILKVRRTCILCLFCLGCADVSQRLKP